MEQLAPTARGSGDHSEVRAAAIALGIALVALNVLDLTVTDLSIRHFGATELNPIMAALLGTPWAVLLKVGLPTAILALTPRLCSGRAVVYLRMAVGVYMAVAIVNLGQLAYALS
jgi:predicted anti-sigma-YlaC factor YlaD